MTKVTITIDDADGKVAVGCEIPGGYNPASLACNMANAIINFLDANGQREPQEAKVVHTLDEYRGKRAAMVSHIEPEPVEIYSGSGGRESNTRLGAH